jgi:hypothetical protein
LKRYFLIASMALTLTLVSSAGAFATPTATTDLLFAPIPTVLPYGEWEYGIRATLGEDLEKGRFYNNSIHGSPFRNLEVGANWNLTRPIGPFSWGAKYQILDNQRDNDFISLAIGTQNITGISGPNHTDENSYIVASRDFGDRLTVYLGYIHFDGDDNDVYGGLNWRWNDRWQLRGEYLGFADNEEALISGGVRYDWIKHVDLSLWVSNDSFADDTTVTFEFALQGDLRDLTMDPDENEDHITW